MKVGLLVGRERSFPEALIETINSRNEAGVTAEMVRLSGTRMDEEIPYRVILDRMSHEVPYYRAYLTKAVAGGTTVINNPFWWSADNKFVECVIAEHLGVAVPKTVLLPNKSYEADIIDESLRNLTGSIPWEEIVSYTGLPAVLKPAIGGGNKNVDIVDSVEGLVEAYDRSGPLTMILQEKIEFELYVRCWVIGREHVRVAGYDHSRPHEERYRPHHNAEQDLLDKIVRDCLTLTRHLGFDMDTVELAVRDGIPYAIDFLNPAPDGDLSSIGPDNFEWVIEHTADLCIRYAQQPPPAQPLTDWQALCDAVPPRV